MTSAAHAPVIHLKNENPDPKNPKDSNVLDPEHAHELGGTLGMAVAGVAGGIIAGAAAGGTLGAVAGSIGAVAGAAIGGAIGGVAGESIARDVNQTLEEKYWEKNYVTRPYIVTGHDYTSYRPAYRAGIDGFKANPTQSFDSLEPSLRNNWNIARGDSKLEWEEARHAVRDAFSRLSTPSN